MTAQWSRVELIRLATVLQDCEDQLAVLGHIMPDRLKEHLEADRVVSVDKILKQHSGAVKSPAAVQQYQVEGAEPAEAKQELRAQGELSSKLETKPLSPDILAYAELDRHFVAQVITALRKELRETGTFRSLLQALAQERKRKAHIRDFIAREEEGRHRIKALQKHLMDIRKTKLVELQRRDEMIAHLKDQLQMMKARRTLEKKYVTSCSELQVYQGQKLNSQQEKQLEDVIKELREKIEEESHVHTELVKFLKEDQISLEETLEMWMECYERDIENKQQELSTLKTNRANNLARLQELAKKYRESEQVVIEDRLEKENLRKQREKEETEWASAVKLQSWWRGTMVRRGLGPYKKGKKPKAKESKKGKKKKK
ncbi:hypothetical protein MATL_G00119850 [Megalops atlanticus]|uniref:Dynein regulatory complex protein 9 n=1 Tax=Megalops atlanticus TaxID=7932 RepID=A0A9D3PXI3_MEGAT|nr:hypothetical protein MATL_G00119850 [Megalops atlanticus]